MSSNATLISQIKMLIEAYARIAPERDITIPDFQAISLMNQNQLRGLRTVLERAIIKKAPGYNLGSLGIHNIPMDRLI